MGYNFNYYPPVSPVPPLLLVVLGCLCCLQLPLTLSVQGAQCPPGHPEMSVTQNRFPSLIDKCMFHLHERPWRMCNRTITLVSTVWKWEWQIHKMTFTHRCAFQSSWTLSSPQSNWTLNTKALYYLIHKIKLKIPLFVQSNCIGVYIRGVRKPITIQVKCKKIEIKSVTNTV